MAEDCVFCKIVKGEINAEKVYEDERTVAFKDLNPVAPHHVLIIPRQHIASMNEFTDEQEGLLGHIFTAAAKVAKDLGIAESGYRCVINNGRGAGQLVFHMHVHLLGGRDMDWPPG